MRRRLAPTVTMVLVLGVCVASVWMLLRTPPSARGGGWQFASLVSAMVASALLLVTFLLPSRIRTVTSYLGLERLLRGHRALALVVLALVLAHVVFVVVHSDEGLAVFDLRHAPPRVWAGTIATLALLALVALALNRRHRRPRYEGWRLAHVLLANLLLVAASLHVLWLHHLTRYGSGRAFFIALAVALLVLTLYRWAWRPLRALRNRYVVDEVRIESANAVTIVLHAVGHPGLDFRPGQFAWLKIGDSPFVFEEHPFSIASAATRPSRKEFTIKALGDFSEVLAGLRRGRHVQLDGPHGAFTLDGLRSEGFVFLAGGVGITPMLSMLRTLADREDPRPVLLVVAGRTADDLLHRSDLEDWGTSLDLTLVEVLEEPPDGWEGEVGRLTNALLEDGLAGRRSRRHRDYFVCGPPPMVAAATGILRDRGVSRRRIHTELFDVV